MMRLHDATFATRSLSERPRKHHVRHELVSAAKPGGCPEAIEASARPHQVLGEPEIINRIAQRSATMGV